MDNYSKALEYASLSKDTNLMSLVILKLVKSKLDDPELFSLLNPDPIIK